MITRARNCIRWLIRCSTICVMNNKLKHVNYSVGWYWSASCFVATFSCSFVELWKYFLWWKIKIWSFLDEELSWKQWLASRDFSLAWDRARAENLNSRARAASLSPISTCRAEFQHSEHNYGLPSTITACRARFRLAELNFSSPNSISACRAEFQLAEQNVGLLSRISAFRAQFRLAELNFDLPSLPISGLEISSSRAGYRL